MQIRAAREPKLFGKNQQVDKTLRTHTLKRKTHTAERPIHYSVQQQQQWLLANRGEKYPPGNDALTSAK